jgi:UDP-3-O-[3-hydroxymyristoyl] glucosamine N-acyltransferase
MMLRDIAAALSAPYVGNGEIEIAGIADPAHAGTTDTGALLALAMTRDAAATLAECQARAAVVSAGCEAALERFEAIIKVTEPRVALAVLTRLFDRPSPVEPEIHPSAIVAPDAVIAEGVGVGPLAVIGARARIGASTLIHAHVTVGADAIVGRDCLIHAGVRIGERVRIGDRVILHHNVSLGADGFSFVTPDAAQAEPGRSGLMRIHSVGTVVLEDDVEVGAGSAIDRATLAATRIGRNTKIDNLVQIGHNVEIGENCLICGMVGISGSVKIGDRVVLGGGVGIADHVTIGSDAVVAGGSGVASNIPPKAVMAGYPAVPRERAFEQVRLLGRLRSLYGEVAELKERIQTLERSGGAAKPPKG